MNENKENISFSKDNFYKSTPKKILIIADAIKAACAFGTAIPLMHDHAKLSLIMLSLLVICEFIHRLFGSKNN